MLNELLNNFYDKMIVSFKFFIICVFNITFNRINSDDHEFNDDELLKNLYHLPLNSCIYIQKNYLYKMILSIKNHIMNILNNHFL